MAARKNEPVDGLQTFLPPPYTSVGGFPVLTEQQLPTRSEDAGHAPERHHDLGNRAQGERGEHGIDAVVFKRNPFPREVQKLDRKRPSLSLAPGKLEHAGSGF
jgi:hypothetical protein